MELNDHVQWVAFFWSLAQGCFLSLFYDLFRMLRKAVDCGRISVFIQDVLYFALSAPIAFLFLLQISDGVLRWYMMFGWIAGFFIWHYTMGWLMLCLWELILWLVAKLILCVSSFGKWLAKPWKKWNAQLKARLNQRQAAHNQRKAKKIAKKEQKYRDKMKNKRQRDLKKGDGLLYNNNDQISDFKEGVQSIVHRKNKNKKAPAAQGRHLSC